MSDLFRYELKNCWLHLIFRVSHHSETKDNQRNTPSKLQRRSDQKLKTQTIVNFPKEIWAFKFSSPKKNHEDPFLKSGQHKRRRRGQNEKKEDKREKRREGKEDKRESRRRRIEGGEELKKKRTCRCRGRYAS